MKRQIFNVACGGEDKARAARLFAMLALRGHPQSFSNLGHHFHSGMGVPVDYDLAIYWLEKAVAADPAREDFVADLEKIKRETP